LATLAVRILGQSETVTTESFRPLPRIRRLTASDLVIAESGTLTFVLPVFEQYFGSEALRSGLVNLETVAAAGSFPRWRYAIAFAVSTATASDQEALMTGLARVNPAAAFWVLDEIANTAADERDDGPSDDAIAALISRRDPTSAAAEADLAIRAGRWLRDAEEALLTGLGPLADTVAQHRNGQLVQWGVWLEDGRVTLAQARHRTPPPDVVKLNKMYPEISLAAGWRSVENFRFPTTEFGRWVHAQGTLQERLQAAIRKKALPVPRTSWLARERLYLLAAFVYDFGSGKRRRPIQVAELRETVGTWMEQVDRSEWSSWQRAGRVIDSDDVRWLSAQLAIEDRDTLQAPWPGPDQPHAGRWAWQGYSPDLTLSMAKDILREALIGYRELVEHSFPTFGDAMGLYGALPVRVDGFVGRFADDDNVDSVGIHLVLHEEPGRSRSDIPAINLQLVTSIHDRTFWELGWDRREDGRRAFAPSPQSMSRLPLHATCPATNVAYEWLVDDLAEVGWLKGRQVILD
jgi:hypothetical protein